MTGNGDTPERVGDGPFFLFPWPLSKARRGHLGKTRTPEPFKVTLPFLGALRGSNRHLLAKPSIEYDEPVGRFPFSGRCRGSSPRKTGRIAFSERPYWRVGAFVMCFGTSENIPGSITGRALFHKHCFSFF